jgi:hypothetical protein
MTPYYSSNCCFVLVGRLFIFLECVILVMFGAVVLGGWKSVSCGKLFQIQVVTPGDLTKALQKFLNVAIIEGAN